MTGIDAKAELHRYLQSGREVLRWLADGADANADMWAQPDESSDDIVGLYRRS